MKIKVFTIHFFPKILIQYSKYYGRLLFKNGLLPNEMELTYLKVVFINIIAASNILKTSRLAVAEKQWPDGIIPFQFSEDTGKDDRAAVQFASLQYMYLSCIKMVDTNLTVNAELLSSIDHQGSINFEAGRKDCYAPVGFSNSKRSARCCNAETCLHEIGHILGLEHEHKRADRNYYIRLIFDNIEQESRTAMLSIQDTQGSDFDFRSVMLYRPTAFSSNGEFIYRVLDSDQIYLLGSHSSLSYYDVKDVNNLYKCRETQCPSFRNKCYHDGFVLKLGGKCKCFCPRGLSSRRRCANIYKPGKPLSRWPTGSYSLLMAGKTCPGKDWLPVNRYHCIFGFVDSSKGQHLGSKPQASRLREKICTISKQLGRKSRGRRRRRRNWESGSYCILKNGDCPPGFENGFIQIKEYNSSILTSRIQKTMAKHCEDFSIRNDYCCRQDDSALKPIKLPRAYPFILLMSSLYESCQQIKDMRAYAEEIKYINQNGYSIIAGGSYPFFYTWEYGLSLKYCYYVPLNQDCGELVKLHKKKRSAILNSPNFPNNYENNLSCNWLIKAPKESIIRLEFLKFSIDGNNEEACTDFLEVRFNMIGQPGIRYCGELPVKVILSSSNLMMLTLKTNYAKVKKGFKAVASVVMNSEFCYNVKDHGLSYRGTVNITKDFEQCVFWNETTKCRHHAFNSRDEIHGVGIHNFCRNPGHGLRPWCYTDANQCTRKYCDACGIAGSYDILPDCKNIIVQNNNFCNQNVSAMKLCHASCGFPFQRVFQNDTESDVDKIKCEAPKAINGDILYQKKKFYQVGEEVVVHCHPGNQWQQKTHCLSNGQWNSGRICGICPSNWTYRDDHCYRFFSERVNYANAEESCQEYDSVVVAPNGVEEFEFILSLTSTEGGVWLGITFKDNKWRNSTGANAQWTNWKAGQPDFKEGEEKCARFLTFDDNKWDDVPCDWLKFNAFLCKRAAVRVALCEDFTDGCEDFIRNSPKFCEENHNFAVQFCSKTCLLCQLYSSV